MTPWHDFYLLTGTAAVTLVGLMFIAVTFGSRIVTPETISMTRAFFYPIVSHFTQAFLLSCFALAPLQTATMLGLVAIFTAIFRLFAIYGVTRQVVKAHRMQGDIEVTDWLLDIVLPVGNYSLLIYAGFGLLHSGTSAYFCLAISVLGLIFLGLFSAWELLVWIATQVE